MFLTELLFFSYTDMKFPWQTDDSTSNPGSEEKEEKVYMRKYYHEFHLDARYDIVWELFTDEHQFEAWNGRNADIYEQENRLEKMNFDGIRVEATTTLSDYRDRLEQDWTFLDDDWEPTPGQKLQTHVSLRFHDLTSRTMLEVTVEPFPDERYDEIERLWRERIIGKIQSYLRRNKSLSQAA